MSFIGWYDSENEKIKGGIKMKNGWHFFVVKGEVFFMSVYMILTIITNLLIVTLAGGL